MSIADACLNMGMPKAATSPSEGPRHLFSCTRLRDIERAHRPSIESFLKNYLRRSKPVILTGLSDNWPCMDWTQDDMRARIGKVKVQRPRADGMCEFTRFMHIPFEEFEQSLTTTRDLYLSVDPILVKGGALPSNSQLKGLAMDIVFPAYCEKKDIQEVNLWVGPGGNKSLLHYHSFHGFLLVLEGRKRFAAYHPSHTKNFYPYSVFNLLATWNGNIVDSKVNAQNVGDEHINRVCNAEGVYGELERGDMLFLPAGTWHYVESNDLNIAINYFFDSRDWIAPKVHSGSTGLRKTSSGAP